MARSLGCVSYMEGLSEDMGGEEGGEEGEGRDVLCAFLLLDVHFFGGGLALGESVAGEELACKLTIEQ